MALKQLWYFLDLSPKIICYYNMFQQKQQPFSTIASEWRGTSMQVHFVSCFLFILNLTIYMIIYKRNIHVWRSMKHFQKCKFAKRSSKLTFKYNDKLEYVFYTGVRCYDSRVVGLLTWPLIHLNQWRWHREMQYCGDQVVIQYQHKMAATLSFDCQPVFPFSPKKNWNNINSDLKLLVFEQYMLIS